MLTRLKAWWKRFTAAEITPDSQFQQWRDEEESAFRRWREIKNDDDIRRGGGNPGY